jgi:hypothetical protein
MTACIICDRCDREDTELREYTIAFWNLREAICRACFERGDEKQDFNDLPLVENEE